MAEAENDVPIIEELDPAQADDAPIIEEVDPAQGAEGLNRDNEEDAPEGEAAEDGGAGGMDEEMKKIEKEKEGMTVTEKLERSFLYKVEGNDFFKKNDVFRAADCYYRAVLYARDLTQDPKYYPKLGHNDAQRTTAKGLVESSFTNLALVQSKHALGLPAGAERDRVLKEAARSAGEALRVNATNAKALYRRGLCRSHLARASAEQALAGEGGETLQRAQELCGEAKADLVAAAKQDDGAGRDARAELKAVQELLKRLKQEELSRDKRGFSFKGSLSALQSKELDILKDGTVRKQQVSQAGDGNSTWFNEDWLLPKSPHRCVVHVKCRLLGDSGKPEPQQLAFALDDGDMHEGVRVAARSLSKGELARFVLAPSRMVARSPLARKLPEPPAQEAAWEIELLRFAVYEDSESNGRQLVKIFSEGYGRFPEEFSECHVHWKVTGPDDATLFSTRQTMSIAGTGLETKEDPDRDPHVYVLGETMWPPVAALCKLLRQGGSGEMRLKHAPELPEKDPGAPADTVSAQLSSALSKRSPGPLRDCTVHVELDRVLPPLQGPEDAAWAGVATLVEERFRAEQLVEKGEESTALRRLRRASGWAESACAAAPEDGALLKERALIRAGLAWVLAKRAAPILDLGTVSSDVLRVAESDLTEAEGHQAWVDEHHPGLAEARLVRAKVLVARSDDFEAANVELLEAQRLAPSDTRVQIELKAVRAGLKEQREAKAREQVTALREGLAAVRTEGLTDSAHETRAAELLATLGALELSWELVMETRIGVEVKQLQEASAEPTIKQLCKEILGRWIDQSKQQRPMWES